MNYIKSHQYRNKQTNKKQMEILLILLMIRYRRIVCARPSYENKCGLRVIAKEKNGNQTKGELKEINNKSSMKK